MKAIIGVFITMLVIAAIIYTGCAVSPEFRNTYTTAANDWQRTVHHTIEDATGIDLPYTVFTADGYITVVK